MQIKQAISNEELCSALPNQFASYLNYVKNLAFDETPNYGYMRGLFKEVLL